MRWTAWLVCIGGVCTLGFADLATAEIYRWTDASGGAHFSTDLTSVPRQHRAEAEASAGTVGRGANLNMISKDATDPEPDSAGPAALRPQSVQLPNASQDTSGRIAGYSEAEWRARVQGLNDEMSALGRRVDACKSLEAPVRYDARTGRGKKRQHFDKKMEIIERCSTDQSSLEIKKHQFENMTETARRQGVPPGWLRTR